MNKADTLHSKAKKLNGQGKQQQARELLEEAVAASPRHVAALTLLGQVCSALGDHHSAAGHLEAVEQLQPGSLETGFMLAYEYGYIGRNQEALALLDRLLSVTPKLAVLHRCRGNCLSELGRNRDAQAAYSEALRLKPDYVDAHMAMGNLLLKDRQLENAKSCFKRALQLDPRCSSAHNELGRIYQLQGRVAEAVSRYRKALDLDPKNRYAASNILFGMCCLNDAEPEAVAEEHFRIADRFYPPGSTVMPNSSKRVPAPGRPLRIGYVSGDLYTHSVASFIEPVLQHHDREKFEIYCYSNHSLSDETTHRIKTLDVHWRDIYGMPAGKVASLVIEDGIDILVDLSGHTARYRLDLFQLKPAPVQVSWIGYPHSTGLEQIDYYLTDPLCAPPGMTEHLFRERLWRLPRIFCCYFPPTEFPPVSPLPCVERGHVTFGCFNNFAKVTDGLIALWSSIMIQVPDSRLLLKSTALGDAALQSRIRSRFSLKNVDPERIVTSPFLAAPQDHLALYSKVDIALDTYPYHGTTTTCEALWMGVPVITLAGRTHASRVGVSLLHSAGLARYIGRSTDDYVELSVKLAKDPQQLASLREQLRMKLAMSPLMDASGVTREVEEAYSLMYQEKKGNT